MAVEKGASDYLFPDKVSPPAIRLACKLNDSLAQMKNSQAGFRSIFNSNPDPVLSVDLARNIINVNEAVCRLTGYSAEEICHTHLSRYVLPEDIEIVSETFAQTVQHSRTIHLPCRIVRKDGTVRQREITRIPMTAEEGLTSIIAVIRNQTDLLQAQQIVKGQVQFLSKQVTQLNFLYAISDVMAEDDDYYAIKQKIVELISGNLKHLGISGARLN